MTTRRVDIQGLRGIAVLLVVLFHTGVTAPGGFVGVDVFFVISGFVITRLLWQELRTTGSLDLVAFYSRRVRRLLPALALVLAFVAVGSAVLQSPLGLQQDTAGIGAASALFTANAALFFKGGGYFALPSNAMPLLHLWTLAVEEQFYLLFPIVTLAAWKVGSRARRLTAEVTTAAAVVTVFALSFALSLLTTYARGQQATRFRLASFAFYASPTRAWEFAVGCCLAMAESRLHRLPRWIATTSGVLGAALLAYAVVRYSGGTPFPGLAALAPVAAAGLLVLQGSTRRTWITALLGVGPLVWIGDLSYGWYLWHWPLIVFTRALWPNTAATTLLLVAAAGLVPTWLSYRLLENPIRLDRRIVGRRALQLGALCSAVPIVLFGGLWASAEHPPAHLAELRHQDRVHLDASAGCQSNLPGDAVTRTRCTWHVPHSKGTVYLIGDSNAGQFAEPGLAGAQREGYDFVLATYGGCGFADVLQLGVGFATAACRDFVTRWTAELRVSDPALVIIAAESAGLVQNRPVQLQDPGTLRIGWTVEEKQHLWQAGLGRTLRTLTRSGAPVVVVHTIPQFNAFDLRTCPALRIYLDEPACGARRTKAQVLAFGQPAREAEAAAVATAPGSAAVDLTSAICPDDVCSTDRNGFWEYRDGAHLSVDGALRLTPRFEAIVRGHARASEA